jgi:glucose/arabinose dehydrogenase
MSIARAGIAGLLLLLPMLALAQVSNLKLPEGFAIEEWANEVPGARSLAQGDDGTVYVATRSTGSVYALADADGEGHPDAPKLVAKGLNMPNGIAFRDGALYVAEVHRLLKFPDIAKQGATPPLPVVIRDDLPKETHHGWRYIAFGPDGKLYLSIGAPCNVCKLETFERDGKALQYGSITRMNADGSGWEVVARGVRNSVGFDWNPADGSLWFTDNGRDWLGDEKPDCELNRLSKLGEDFGFPYCHAGDIGDPEFGKDASCSAATPPMVKLGPHVAPLGVEFYRGQQFPAAYRGAMFVALHGSWNRSKKSGYEVVVVQKDGQGYSVQPFIEGWLEDERVSGRPVDFLTLADGSLLVSDDSAGKIYRVRYTPGTKAG